MKLQILNQLTNFTANKQPILAYKTRAVRYYSPMCYYASNSCFYIYVITQYHSDSALLFPTINQDRFAGKISLPLSKLEASTKIVTHIELNLLVSFIFVNLLMDEKQSFVHLIRNQILCAVCIARQQCTRNIKKRYRVLYRAIGTCTHVRTSCSICQHILQNWHFPQKTIDSFCLFDFPL